MDKAVLADYQKARQRLKKREAHENGLLNSEGAEQLEKFREYLALEKDDGEPARVQCLYERAVAEHCLVAQVWEEYIAYLESTIKIETVITPVYTRAIRNCPWAVELWCGQLRAYEKYEKESHEVTKVFEQVQHLFPQPYFLQNKQRVTALFSLSGFGTNEAEETMLKNLGVNVNSVYVLYHLLDKFLITNFLNIIKQ